jgi:hypothetical protein
VPIVVERHEDLIQDLDGGEVMDGRLLLVCGHGSRDQCCASRGTPVFGALAAAFMEDELWISSNSGHRFAGNVLVLPVASTSDASTRTTHRRSCSACSAGESN